MCLWQGLQNVHQAVQGYAQAMCLLRKHGLAWLLHLQILICVYGSRLFWRCMWHALRSSEMSAACRVVCVAGA